MAVVSSSLGTGRRATEQIFSLAKEEDARIATEIPRETFGSGQSLSGQTLNIAQQFLKCNWLP